MHGVSVSYVLNLVCCKLTAALHVPMSARLQFVTPSNTSFLTGSCVCAYVVLQLTLFAFHCIGSSWEFDILPVTFLTTMPARLQLHLALVF